MQIQRPNCHHTYPKTDNVRYSLAYTHNSYSYHLILLVLYYTVLSTTSGQLKISNRDFSKTAGLAPIFEARIVFYDQIWVYNSVSKTL